MDVECGAIYRLSTTTKKPRHPRRAVRVVAQRRADQAFLLYAGRRLQAQPSRRQPRAEFPTPTAAM